MASSHWQASLSEHRTAWIIACCCIIAIFLASTWPGLFSFQSTPPASENRQSESHVRIQQKTRFSTPKKQASRPAKKQPQQVSGNKKTNSAVVSEKKVQTGKKNQLKTSATQPEKAVVTLGAYYIQAGAFREKTLAQKLVNRIKENGWNAVIVPRSELHAVWVGPENSRSDVKNLQKSILRTLKIEGFIVQKKPS